MARYHVPKIHVLNFQGRMMRADHMHDYISKVNYLIQMLYILPASSICRIASFPSTSQPWLGRFCKCSFPLRITTYLLKGLHWREMISSLISQRFPGLDAISLLSLKIG